MDRWVDPILQEIPTRMPTGLKSLGVGFGAGGLPLLNIAQISSWFTYWLCSSYVTEIKIISRLQ